MLKLMPQDFGHLMQRANSLEKTLMLGKTEGRRRRGQQRMRHPYICLPPANSILYPFALINHNHEYVPWTARSNQSILKEINPEYSLEGVMLKLKLQYFGHLMQGAGSLEKILMLGKTEGRRPIHLSIGESTKDHFFTHEGSTGVTLWAER